MGKNASLRKTSDVLGRSFMDAGTTHGGSGSAVDVANDSREADAGPGTCTRIDGEAEDGTTVTSAVVSCGRPPRSLRNGPRVLAPEVAANRDGTALRNAALTVVPVVFRDRPIRTTKGALSVVITTGRTPFGSIALSAGIDAADGVDAVVSPERGASG